MNDNICIHYIIGVSIGSMMEPTSIAVIEQETRVRKTVSIFGSLPPGINQAAANTFGKRVKELAAGV